MTVVMSVGYNDDYSQESTRGAQHTPTSREDFSKGVLDTTMKLGQLIRAGIGFVVIVYLLIIERANGLMQMPFLFPIPSALALLLAIGGGYVAAWLPMRARVRSLQNQLNRLEERIAKPPASLPKPSNPQQTTSTNKTPQAQ
jgi:hypothetical protein